MQPCNYWKYDTLHAVVERGSAFFEDITKRNANFAELPHTLNIYGGNIDVSFVLSSKGILVCNSSSSVLVLNRTSPSLLHTRGGSRGRVEGGATPPFGKFSNLSGYPCLSLFHTKNNIISYNISSSPIDHYKKIVAIPLLNSSIIQMQDRFSDEDRHARHLLCLVPSIIVNRARQLDRVK